MKEYKKPFSIRGDSFYCPLPFSLDPYWNCSIDCVHCYLRKLNFIWGKEQRAASMNEIVKKLVNGLVNKKPRSPLAFAIKKRKTVRLGNKTDPFQPIEEKKKISKKSLRVLKSLDFSVVIQTKSTELMMKIALDEVLSLGQKVIVMPVISPGLEMDWEVFENKRSTHPIERLKHLRELSRLGVKVGVNGEPFIPGYHTFRDFRRTLSVLKEYSIPSYNTYHLHYEAFNAKRLHSIGVDIEKIWYYSQPHRWRKILHELINIAREKEIILGCPDWVNSGDYIEKSNTCCGIDVPNPCTFNVITWKRMKMKNPRLKKTDIIFHTSDGVGDFKTGWDIMFDKRREFYTAKDSGVF